MFYGIKLVEPYALRLHFLMNRGLINYRGNMQQARWQVLQDKTMQSVGNLASKCPVWKRIKGIRCWAPGRRNSKHRGPEAGMCSGIWNTTEFKVARAGVARVVEWVRVRDAPRVHVRQRKQEWEGKSDCGEPSEPLPRRSLHSVMESHGHRPVFSPPRSVGAC